MGFLRLLNNLVGYGLTAAMGYLTFHSFFIREVEFHAETEAWIIRGVGLFLTFAVFGTKINIDEAIGEPIPENNEMTIFDRIQAAEAAEKG